MNCVQAGCREPRPAECHCARCHETFGTLTMFDAHQDVDHDTRPAVSCREPGTLGAVTDARGTWQTPAGLISRARNAERLRAARAA